MDELRPYDFGQVASSSTGPDMWSFGWLKDLHDFIESAAIRNDP
jgi:hypothetical protein